MQIQMVQIKMQKISKVQMQRQIIEIQMQIQMVQIQMQRQIHRHKSKSPG